MTSKHMGKLLATAMTAMMVGGVATLSSCKMLGMDKSACCEKGDKHACKGQNSCKGMGGCSSGDNGCKGKNSCKGKGGCSTADKGDKHSCKAK